MKQLYRKHKRLCIFFFVVFVAVYICTFTVSADGCAYDSWEYDLVKRINVAGMFSDMFISIKSSILVKLAEIIDDFSKAIDTLLSINLYEGIKNVFNIETSIYPIAWGLFTLAIIVAGIFLMIFPDKLKISNLMKSILISGCLLIAMPSLFSVMTDIKNAGINDVKNISITGSKGVNHTIGDELLAAVTVDMRESGKVGKVRFISQTDRFKRKTGICYGLDYTKTLSNTAGDFKWKVTDIDAEESSQKLFEDLTFDDYLFLMGIYDDFALCEDAKEIYDRISSSTVNKHNATDDEIKGSGGWILVLYAGNSDFIGPTTKYVDPYTYYNDYLVPIIVNKTAHCNYLKDKEKNTIKKELLSSDKGGACGIGTASPQYKLHDYEDDKNSANVEVCVRRIIDYLMENGYMEKLNTENNEKEFEKGTTYDYSYVSLHTQEDHEELGTVKQVLDYLDGDHFGKPTERIYAYDLDFVKGFILMIAVFVSFLFAGLKLTRMLYDILFMQVIAPLVFASDLQESGRTKKMISEIISSFIVIILIFLIIKLYIIVLLWSFSKNFSIVVTLCIIIGGAGFVIDGPDIVVKLLGVDAGVKSGHGMLMGAMAGVNLAKNAGKGAANMVKGAGHIAGKGANIAKPVASKVGKEFKSFATRRITPGAFKSLNGNSKSSEKNKLSENNKSQGGRSMQLMDYNTITNNQNEKNKSGKIGDPNKGHSMQLMDYQTIANKQKGNKQNQNNKSNENSKSGGDNSMQLMGYQTVCNKPGGISTPSRNNSPEKANKSKPHNITTPNSSPKPNSNPISNAKPSTNNSTDSNSTGTLNNVPPPTNNDGSNQKSALNNNTVKNNGKEN